MFEVLWKKSCSHDKITANMKAGYCPDCGDYIENHWYITRCECCGVKQKSMVHNGKIVTDTHFCKNCGSSSFVLEELDCLNIVNVNYAVVKKHAIKTKTKNAIQTWIEENTYAPMKLLPAY